MSLLKGRYKMSTQSAFCAICTIKKIIGFAIFGIVGTAAAAPVTLTFQSQVDAVSGSLLPGLTSVGDVFFVEVVVDNGSSSLISQSWTVTDTISATVTAGSFSAVFTSNFFTSPVATGFVTDESGNLVQTNWFGTFYSPTAIDNFGTGGELLNSGSLSTASNGDQYSFADDFGTVANWSVVPIPAAVWLFSSGLIGLIGIARRKKSIVIRC
jgi:hypothetical protein